MTHGYHRRSSRGRRVRRKLRRPRMKPMIAHRKKNEPLKYRVVWTRKHPTVSSFSYGKRIKRGRRRL